MMIYGTYNGHNELINLLKIALADYSTIYASK